MIIKIISFTKNGYELSERIRNIFNEQETELIFKGRSGDIEKASLPLDEICRQSFETGAALIFIGAMGIAVRHIAPYVKDKLTDPPVIVADELGRHVIPVLSGHVGGANELAYLIAENLGADPVITTATDLNKAFSVDLFAKENGLNIVNRDGIAKVSVKALSGKPVTLSIKDYPPKEPVDVVITDDENAFSAGKIALCPPGKNKRYAVGIGCKKGKTAEEIEAHVFSCLKEAGLTIDQVFAAGTVDIKAEEPGLKAFLHKNDIPLLAFEASVLAKAEGDFTSSGFVAQTVGVDNVCERAAIMAAGTGSKLILKKTAKDGVTCAVAEAHI